MLPHRSLTLVDQEKVYIHHDKLLDRLSQALLYRQTEDCQSPIGHFVHTIIYVKIDFKISLKTEPQLL